MRDKPDVIDAEFEIIKELPKPARRSWRIYMVPGWWIPALGAGLIGLLQVLRP